MGCGFCDSRSKRGYFCHNCIARRTDPLRKNLDTLREQYDKELERLDSLLSKKQPATQADESCIGSLQRETAAHRSRAAFLLEQLSQVVSETAQLQNAIASKEKALRDGRSQTLSQLKKHNREQARRNEEQFRHMVSLEDSLAKHQRIRVMRNLMIILPLQLISSGSDGSYDENDSAVSASLRGELLPSDMGDILSSSPTTLGYLALLLDVLSRFLSLPLLLRVNFRGSTSSVWRPSEGFYDLRTHPPRNALPLYDTSNKSDASFIALHQSSETLAEAVMMLQKGAAALVYAKLGPDAPLRIPPHWPPCAWLAGLCKILCAEPRYNLAASAVFGRQMEVPPFDEAGLPAVQQEEEGWELMPEKFFPPPPSAPEDVEHWSRAVLFGESSHVIGIAAPVIDGAQHVVEKLKTLAVTTWESYRNLTTPGSQ